MLSWGWFHQESGWILVLDVPHYIDCSNYSQSQSLICAFCQCTSWRISNSGCVLHHTSSRWTVSVDSFAIIGVWFDLGPFCNDVGLWVRAAKRMMITHQLTVGVQIRAQARTDAVHWRHRHSHCGLQRSTFSLCKSTRLDVPNLEANDTSPQ